MAIEITEGAAPFNSLVPDAPATRVTPAMIAALQPDCCSIAWDLTRSLRSGLAGRAPFGYMDQFHTFVRVEITEPRLLPPLVNEMTFFVPVTACGNAETRVQTETGWRLWTPPEM